MAQDMTGAAISPGTQPAISPGTQPAPAAAAAATTPTRLRRTGQEVEEEDVVVAVKEALDRMPTRTFAIAALEAIEIFPPQLAERIKIRFGCSIKDAERIVRAGRGTMLAAVEANIDKKTDKWDAETLSDFILLTRMLPEKVQLSDSRINRQALEGLKKPYGTDFFGEKLVKVWEGLILIQRDGHTIGHRCEDEHFICTEPPLEAVEERCRIVDRESRAITIRMERERAERKKKEKPAGQPSQAAGQPPAVVGAGPQEAVAAQPAAAPATPRTPPAPGTRLATRDVTPKRLTEELTEKRDHRIRMFQEWGPFRRATELDRLQWLNRAQDIERNWMNPIREYERDWIIQTEPYLRFVAVNNPIQLIVPKGANWTTQRVADGVKITPRGVQRYRGLESDETLGREWSLSRWFETHPVANFAEAVTVMAAYYTEIREEINRCKEHIERFRSSPEGHGQLIFTICSLRILEKLREMALDPLVEFTEDYERVDGRMPPQVLAWDDPRAKELARWAKVRADEQPTTKGPRTFEKPKTKPRTEAEPPAPRPRVEAEPSAFSPMTLPLGQPPPPRLPFSIPAPTWGQSEQEAQDVGTEERSAPPRRTSPPAAAAAAMDTSQDYPRRQTTEREWTRLMPDPDLTDLPDDRLGQTIRAIRKMRFNRQWGKRILGVIALKDIKEMEWQKEEHERIASSDDINKLKRWIDKVNPFMGGELDLPDCQSKYGETALSEFEELAARETDPEERQLLYLRNRKLLDSLMAESKPLQEFMDSHREMLDRARALSMREEEESGDGKESEQGMRGTDGRAVRETPKGATGGLSGGTPAKRRRESELTTPKRNEELDKTPIQSPSDKIPDSPRKMDEPRRTILSNPSEWQGSGRTSQRMPKMQQFSGAAGENVQHWIRVLRSKMAADQCDEETVRKGWLSLLKGAALTTYAEREMFPTLQDWFDDLEKRYVPSETPTQVMQEFQALRLKEGETAVAFRTRFDTLANKARRHGLVTPSLARDVYWRAFQGDTRYPFLLNEPTLEGMYTLAERMEPVRMTGEKGMKDPDGGMKPPARKPVIAATMSDNTEKGSVTPKENKETEAIQELTRATKTVVDSQQKLLAAFERSTNSPGGRTFGRGGPGRGFGRGNFGRGGYGRGGFGRGSPGRGGRMTTGHEEQQDGQSGTCYNCGRPGHKARECRSEQRQCYLCQEKGHLARDCPNGRVAEPDCFLEGRPRGPMHAGGRGRQPERQREPEPEIPAGVTSYRPRYGPGRDTETRMLMTVQDVEVGRTQSADDMAKPTDPGPMHSLDHNVKNELFASRHKIEKDWEDKWRGKEIKSCSYKEKGPRVEAGREESRARARGECRGIEASGKRITPERIRWQDELGMDDGQDSSEEEPSEGEFIATINGWTESSRTIPLGVPSRSDATDQDRRGSDPTSIPAQERTVRTTEPDPWQGRDGAFLWPHRKRWITLESKVHWKSGGSSPKPTLEDQPGQGWQGGIRPMPPIYTEEELRQPIRKARRTLDMDQIPKLEQPSREEKKRERKPQGAAVRRICCDLSPDEFELASSIYMTLTRMTTSENVRERIAAAMDSTQELRTSTTSARILTVLATVGHQECRPLIDTGAEVSAISARFLAKVQKYCEDRKIPEPTIEQSKITLRMGNNSITRSLGAVILPIILDGGHKVLTGSFEILPESCMDVFLGMNFLAKQGIVIDTGTGALTIPDEPMKFQAITAFTQERILETITAPLGIYAAETKHIPALYNGHMRTRIVQDGQGMNGLNVLGFVHEHNNPYYISSVAPGAGIHHYWNGTGYIFITNFGRQDVTLHEGDLVGFLECRPDKMPKIVDERIRDALLLAVMGEDKKERDKEIQEVLSKLDMGKQLTEEERKGLEELIKEYADIWWVGHPGEALGQTQSYRHQLDTGDARPINQPPRRLGIKEREQVEQEIKKMLELGVIRPSMSPWSSPTVLVRKPDGSVRFCVDYRKLNDVTVSDVYPLPRVDDTLDALGKARYFSTLDLASGYWQVPMAEESIPKTAFITHAGLYEFTVLPFGLKTAPSAFQRLMDVVLAGLKWQSCLVYIDDIIIFSVTYGQHLQDLRGVFERLRNAGLKCKLKKCHLAQSEVVFLGHVISAAGVKPNPMKIQAIMDFLKPDVSRMSEKLARKVLRGFLGLTSYYRRFIRDYSTIAEPLTRLTSRTEPFIWTRHQEEAWETLKRALISTPILCHPDFNREFILQTDASDVGISGVLSQRRDDLSEAVIAYISRTLNRTERNWPVAEREALAVVWACTVLRPYLLHRQFLIQTDNAAVSAVFKAGRAQNGKLARWSMAMSEYDFVIEHRKGSANANADALSRYFSPMLPFPASLEGIGRYQETDPYFGEIMAYLRHGTAPISRKWRKNPERISEVFEIRNDVLYHKATTRRYRRLRRWKRDDPPRIAIPTILVPSCLAAMHDADLMGHGGYTRTLRQVSERYKWPRLKQDVKRWVASCIVCQKFKRTPDVRQGLTHPIETSRPFETVAVDIVGPFPPSRRGYRYIVTMVDLYTKWAEAAPLRSITAKNVASVIYKQIICRHGCPTRILSDNGKQFVANVTRRLMEKLKVAQVFAAPYHPETNGQVERLHRTLISMISMLHYQSQELAPRQDGTLGGDWDEYLHPALFAYRAAPIDRINISPFEILYGRPPVNPMDVMRDEGNQDDGPEDLETYHLRHVKRLRQIYDWLNELREADRKLIKEYRDKSRHEIKYEIGSKVLFLRPMGLSQHLVPKWLGPFTVRTQIGPNTYLIENDQSHMKKVANVARMRNYEPLRPEDGILDDEDDGVKRIHQGEERQEYPVEELMMRRQRGLDEAEYLVKWSGYPHSQDEWRPESALPATVLAMYDPAQENQWKPEYISDGPRREEGSGVEQYCVQYTRKRSGRRLEWVAIWMDTEQIDADMIETYLEAKRKGKVPRKAPRRKSKRQMKKAPPAKESKEEQDHEPEKRATQSEEAAQPRTDDMPPLAGPDYVDPREENNEITRHPPIAERRSARIAQRNSDRTEDIPEGTRRRKRETPTVDDDETVRASGGTTRRRRTNQGAKEGNQK